MMALSSIFIVFEGRSTATQRRRRGAAPFVSRRMYAIVVQQVMDPRHGGGYCQMKPSQEQRTMATGEREHAEYDLRCATENNGKGEGCHEVRNEQTSMYFQLRE